MTARNMIRIDTRQNCHHMWLKWKTNKKE